MALIRKSKTTNGKFLTKSGGQGPGDETRAIEIPGEKGGKYEFTITQSDKDAVSRDSRYTKSFGDDAAAVYASGGRFMNIEGKDVLIMGKGTGQTDFLASGNQHVGYVRTGGNQLRKVLVSKDFQSFAQADPMTSGELFDGRKILTTEIAPFIMSSKAARINMAKETGQYQTFSGGAGGRIQSTQIQQGDRGRFPIEDNKIIQQNKK